jgi:hypothetical protein
LTDERTHTLARVFSHRSRRNVPVHGNRHKVQHDTASIAPLGARGVRFPGDIDLDYLVVG